jgi:hypothetical protein
MGARLRGTFRCGDGNASRVRDTLAEARPQSIDRTTAAGGPEGLNGELEWKAIRRRLDQLDPFYKT